MENRDGILIYYCPDFREDYDYKGSGISSMVLKSLIILNCMEWNIPKGGNSGIFYHLKEGYDGPTVAPEYQLLDDENYAEIHNYELKDWQLTAADYAMYVLKLTKKKYYILQDSGTAVGLFLHPEK